MQRFNVFLLVHKGLRAMMYDTSLSLQHTDFAYTDTYPQSLKKLAATIDIFDAHAGHEDKYIFSLLEPHAPALLQEMEAEHVTDHALSEQLRSLMATYKTATEPAEKGAAGIKICHAFHEFIAFNLTHLNKEETIVNEALWNNYTDLDIIQANQRLVSILAPEEAKGNATWMIRSCSNMEIISWINAIKNNIPQALLQMLLQIAEEELPVHRFGVIQDGIMSMA